MRYGFQIFLKGSTIHLMSTRAFTNLEEEGKNYSYWLMLMKYRAGDAAGKNNCLCLLLKTYKQGKERPPAPRMTVKWRRSKPPSMQS